MNSGEREGVLQMQAEIASLGALLRCVRIAAENGQPESLIASALASCEDVATSLVDRIDDIPGLNDAREGGQ